jgi:hypothetical protein
MPAKAGIQFFNFTAEFHAPRQIPACAGMTRESLMPS